MPEDDVSRSTEEKKEASVDVQLGGRHLTLAVTGLALFGLVLFLLGRWSERVGRSEAPPEEIASMDSRSQPSPDSASAPKDLTFYDTLGKKSTAPLQEPPKSETFRREPHAELPPPVASVVPAPKPVPLDAPEPSNEVPAQESPKTVNPSPKTALTQESPKTANPSPKAAPTQESPKTANLSPKAASPAQPVAAPASKAPIVKEHYRVQVASTRDLASARQLVDKLRRKGYEAAIETARGSEGHSQYKVRIGNYSERESAEKIAEKIRQEERVGAWIVKVQG